MPLTFHVPDLVYPSGLNPWQSAYIFALVFLRIPTASLPNASRTSPDIVKQSAQACRRRLHELWVSCRATTSSRRVGAILGFIFARKGCQ